MPDDVIALLQQVIQFVYSLPLLLRFAILAVVTWWLRGWLPAKNQKLVNSIRLRNRKLGAYLQYTLSPMEGLLELTYALALFGLGSTFLFQIAFPPLLLVASSYHSRLLEFASTLITASSVLMGFSIAAEAIRTTRSFRGQRLRISGLACVVFAIGAIIFNGLSDPATADYLISGAVLALLVETLLAANVI